MDPSIRYVLNDPQQRPVGLLCESHPSAIIIAAIPRVRGLNLHVHFFISLSSMLGRQIAVVELAVRCENISSLTPIRT